MASPKPGQAYLQPIWKTGPGDKIPCQFNPTELSLEKTSQFAEINIPGLIAPLQQFVRGHAEMLTVELFFDTSDKGTGAKAESVTTLTDLVYSLTRIEPTGHAPPLVTFYWGSEFPGNRLPEKQANQKRKSFTGIVVSIRQNFTFWSRGGVPLRAKVNLSIREYLTLEQQLRQLNPSSPDRTHGHILRHGETLDRVADRYYSQRAEWRRIASDNGIDDPRRLTPGTRLRVPRIDTGPAVRP
jgi:hypothetical protein